MKKKTPWATWMSLMSETYHILKQRANPKTKADWLAASESYFKELAEAKPSSTGGKKLQGPEGQKLEWNNLLDKCWLRGDAKRADRAFIIPLLIGISDKYICDDLDKYLRDKTVNTKATALE
jgi:hypothetical protein